MKKLWIIGLPWLLCAALACAAWFLRSEQESLRAEVRSERERNLEMRNVADGGRAPADAMLAAEVESLRENNRELYKLRNEVTQLRQEVTQSRQEVAQSRQEVAQSRQEKQALAQAQELQRAERILNVEVQAGQACINTLRRIDGARDQWALEAGRRTGDLVRPEDIAPFFRRGGVPVCANGGAYTISPYGTPVACSIHGALP